MKDFRYWFPAGKGKSLGLVVAVSFVLGIADVVLATKVFGEYGWGLFVGTPLVLGIIGPLLHGMGAPRTFLQLFGAAVLAQIALFMGMVVFAIEGVICILMAAPLWLLVAAIGCCIAYPLHKMMWRDHWPQRGFPVMILLLVLVAPLMTGAEKAANEKSDEFVLTSEVVIDAPPEVVWAHLVAFPQMPQPGFWMFHVGVAYPVRAEIDGTGLGATRYCVFSTGKAKESVTAWEPGRVLAFDVLTTPPPMKEMSIYPDLQPAHLDGYLVSERARFELIELPGGRTRLIGTSWYRNELFPGAYWRLWSDLIIHKIHQSVFTSVKTRSEAAMKGR